MWNTDTLEQMEETAKNEADHECNKKIRGEWLEVKYAGSMPGVGPFFYKWGRNWVSRDVAKNVLESA